MKIWDKIFRRKYLDWNEYKEKIDALEEKHWKEATKPKFRVSK